jgi:hypothetical protein
MGVIAEFVPKRTLSSIEERRAGISQRPKPILERFGRQIDDAQAVFDAAMRHGLAEKGALEEIISAHRQLIKVKLASCGTLAERIAVLTDALKTLQELESSVSEAIDAAVLPYSAISQARQYRVETEVELAKLQSSPGS